MGLHVPDRPENQSQAWILVNAVPLLEDGLVCQVYATFEDITERVLLTQEIRRQATTDFLTGAPNRRSFMSRLALEFGRVRRHPHLRCGMLALDLIDAMGVDLDLDIATCLYAAITGDTGSFRYPATTPASMRAAARLMETGIDFAGVAKALFDTKSREFIALQADVIGNLQVSQVDGLTVAVARVPGAARRELGIAFTDVEALIDSVRTVAGVDVSVVLKEDDHGTWRVSSRSTGVADVGAICTSLGGGGHRLAAGFTGTSDADETISSFLGALAA
jgi:phosphoesterase RecJ-like protein